MLYVTDLAWGNLQKYFHNNNEICELIEDKVGCTCSEESILSLKITNTPSKESTVKIDSNLGTFYTSKKQNLILDNKLILDYNPKLLAFTLKGEHQGLINPRLLIKN